ncbi:diacylglycerol kinase (ATP) [Desulfonispora thiosulfatigenes DSM 11270]|uniref:Diacylglycerol kinase (ATP) n=1 Tax=Desulfonispora thiosulfatigenes DSM 11270 TaxID=656914 RepID=A0A1W1VC06_DESTI|nr:diacylglycerol kinase family protein [Desulfonispora thiosulfatigenes]SMB90997.1 diacylglycerol kinase (ATP) [Desulfonispora thiosulfatigenes DSM 11270]
MKNSSFRKSFYIACKGLKYAIVTERNIKIHLIMAVLVSLLGWYLGISNLEWLIVILTITLVIVLEIVNTVVENIVDLITLEYHPLAAIAKDLSAGAVLVAALGAAIVGAVTFLKYLT